MKKKTIKRISVLSLVLALAGTGLGGFLLLTRPEDNTQQLEQLRQENQALQEQMAQLEAQLDQFMTLSSLASWELTAAAWTDSTGADVTLTAVPAEYLPGMGATLMVMHGEKQAASVACVWNGTEFSGTVSLNAADGYSYYCLLSGPNGTQQLTLMDPESEDAGVPVYLQSALSSYCNLVVNDWSLRNNDATLSLNKAYAQVQLPQIQSRELTITSQELVLRLNGQKADAVSIKLAPSEVAGSHEMEIRELQLPLPELTDGDLLELYLEITLSDGRHLRAFGISWHLEGGQLVSSVG